MRLRVKQAALTCALALPLVLTFVFAGPMTATTDAQAAMRMVVETMAGSAAWLARHGYDGAELRARVATPGGTTEQGLIALEQGGLGDLVQATVDQVVEATR